MAKVGSTAGQRSLPPMMKGLTPCCLSTSMVWSISSQVVGTESPYCSNMALL